MSKRDIKFLQKRLKSPTRSIKPIGSKECRFREDGDCSKCPSGTLDAKKNEWVGYCVSYLGEPDCKAC